MAIGAIGGGATGGQALNPDRCNRWTGTQSRRAQLIIVEAASAAMNYAMSPIAAEAAPTVCRNGKVLLGQIIGERHISLSSDFTNKFLLISQNPA